jgi:hypothetical protein
VEAVETTQRHASATPVLSLDTHAGTVIVGVSVVGEVVVVVVVGEVVVVVVVTQSSMLSCDNLSTPLSVMTLLLGHAMQEVPVVWSLYMFAGHVVHVPADEAYCPLKQVSPLPLLPPPPVDAVTQSSMLSCDNLSTPLSVMTLLLGHAMQEVPVVWSLYMFAGHVVHVPADEAYCPLKHDVIAGVSQLSPV